MGNYSQKSMVQQIEEELREHGEKIVTLKGYSEFKNASNMKFTVEDVADNDNLVRLVRW